MYVRAPEPWSAAAREHLLSALLWTGVAIVIAAFVVASANLSGLTISFAPWPWAKAALMSVALALAAAACHKVAPRSAVALGSFLLLTLSGMAAGTLSMAGQLFGFPVIDGQLAAADGFLGITAAEVTAAVVSIPGAPKLLGAVYVLSIMLMFLSAFALSCTGRFERVWELCAASAFCITVATIVSVVFPAAGAFEYLGLHAAYGSDLPGGAGVYHLHAFHELRTASAITLDPFRLEGLVTFPSFHTAMALMTAAAWRDDRFLRWPMIVWNALVVISTVPIGGHYLVDVFAGAATWLVVFRYGPTWVGAVAQWRLAPQLEAELA